MTKKEILIKLFKEKISENQAKIVISHTGSGHLNYGCQFWNNKDVCFVSIDNQLVRIEFNGVFELLEVFEYTELKQLYDLKKEQYDQKLREKLLEREALTLKTLAEIASIKNYDTSRRVLTEKKTEKDNLKF